MGWAHALAARNAEKLCRLTGMERCAFVTTGSEATTLALRLCRLHTGRPRVVIFDGSYHGHFDAFLGYPADAAAPGQCAPVAPGIPEAYTRDLIVLPYDEEASLVYIEQHHREIACIFCEAIQNRNPAAVPADFLRRLRALTSERGIVLVFDEVVTGFRVAAGGVQERLGIRCDLACYGKALGGGYPVGCVAGRAELLEGASELAGGTYSQHPLCMAAAGAVLDHIIERGDELFTTLNATAERFASRINAWWTTQGLALRVDRFCSMLRFQIPAPMSLAFYQALKLNGVYCWEARTCFMTTAHTMEDADFAVEACQKTTRQLQAHGIALPRLHPTPS